MGYDEYLIYVMRHSADATGGTLETADELKVRRVSRPLTSGLHTSRRTRRNCSGRQRSDGRRRCGCDHAGDDAQRQGYKFPIVYILDANEGITPHSRAMLDEDMEEERRLFYVAMTRAKTRLHVYAVREVP